MKTGNFSRTVWRRSGAKQFHTEREEVLFGLSPEETCAALKGEEGKDFLWAQAAVSGCSAGSGYFAALKAAGDLAARGAQPKALSVRLLLPPDRDEETVKEFSAAIEAACKRMHIQTACFQGEFSPAAAIPTVCVSAAGTARRDEIMQCRMVRPGQSIVLCGYTGLEGTLRILDEAEEELNTRFTSAFLEKTRELERELVTGEAVLEAVSKAGKIQENAGITAVHQIGSGGIMAALWDLTEASGTGLEAEMSRMTIRQETVEICEFYRLNPYLLTSSGSFLIAADDAGCVLKVLEKAGIRAGKLGVATEQNAKVISGRDEIRYLDRPAPDELVRWWVERLRNSGGKKNE